MKRLIFFNKILLACFMLTIPLTMAAQGVIVYKKDGSKVVHHYEEVDCIVTFNVGEVVPGAPGDANANVRTFTVNGVSFNMVRVEGGTFQMGATPEQENPDSDESPVHSVTLSTYYMGETEVTQELWTAVMGSNPSFFTGNYQLPVESVSWDDCQTFIAKLNELTGENFRLPTEAQWEYAARGGNQSKGYQYSGSNTLIDVAWFDNLSSTTHPVATKQPNELGLYDMSGNVYEWCQDWYGSYSSEAVTNPTGPASGSYRVRRGGGWLNDASFFRISFRGSSTPSDRVMLLGLRVAL